MTLKGKGLEIGKAKEVEAPTLRGRGLGIGRKALGDMVQPAQYETTVTSHVTYLEALETKRTVDWQVLLSGGSEESKLALESVVNPKRCVREAGAELDRSVVGIHTAVKGPDYGELQDKYPNNRYKFYHSIADKRRGEAYLTEVIRQASERGLSLTIKTFDHVYDNPNLYTWHPNEMAEIIARIQPLYADAFAETEHFLQGTISGVNQRHVGWVQEPYRAKDSHSVRMGRLGEVLDESGLSEETYRLGCTAAGVKPATPWLLAEL